MWAQLGAMLAQLVAIKSSKKHCKPQDFLMVGGLSWGYVGPSWGYVGLSWGQCGPILGLCWPILGLCWPILGLCWPILGAMLPLLRLCGPILRPMLAHVGPSWATRAEKLEKMGAAKNTVKHGFLEVPGGRRQGAQPLSPSERRESLRQGHGQHRARRAPDRI